jgi:hypothetical protein
MGVVDGNCIFSEEKPKPASIAAIPIDSKSKTEKYVPDMEL